MNWIAQLGAYLSHLRFWYQVMPWERAVRVRRGAAAVVVGPGFHWKIPVLDRVYVQGMRTRTINLPQQTVTRQGREPLTFSAVVRYRIKDILATYELCENFEALVHCVALSALAFTACRADGDFERDARARLAGLLEGYGLCIEDLSLTDRCHARPLRLIVSQETPWWSGSNVKMGEHEP